MCVLPSLSHEPADTVQEMASESVRMLKEKIASDNLFKAKAVGETQVDFVDGSELIATH